MSWSGGSSGCGGAAGCAAVWPGAGLRSSPLATRPALAGPGPLRRRARRPSRVRPADPRRRIWPCPARRPGQPGGQPLPRGRAGGRAAGGASSCRRVHVYRGGASCGPLFLCRGGTPGTVLPPRLPYLVSFPALL